MKYKSSSAIMLAEIPSNECALKSGGILPASNSRLCSDSGMPATTSFLRSKSFGYWGVFILFLLVGIPSTAASSRKLYASRCRLQSPREHSNLLSRMHLDVEDRF